MRGFNRSEYIVWTPALNIKMMVFHFSTSNKFPFYLPQRDHIITLQLLFFLLGLTYDKEQITQPTRDVL